MSKNIKRIIAVALAVGIVSAAAPATNYNFLTTKAYASNDDSKDVDSISLVDRNGISMKLYTSTNYTTEASVHYSVGDTFYTTTTTSSVKITDIIGPDDDKVRIFRGNDTDSNDDYEIGDSISLTDDTTTLKVRVYERNYNDNKNYSSSDYNQYFIKVKYTGSSDLDDDDDDDDDDNDDDYLDSLYLYNKSGDEIQLYEDSKYEDKLDSDDLDDDNEGDTYYAKTSSNVVSIETSGPDDDYVRVFKSTNDSAKAVETGDDISVSEDKTLTVRIYDDEPDDDVTYEEDDDVIGEYKIKLHYTGNGSASTNTGSTTTGTVSTVKANQWVQVNGYWKYNDALGNPLRSQWFYDGYYGKWYYLGWDGVMASNSWLWSGGKWYYVGYSGAMLTNSWILTGGKYYYVGSDGAMVTNTYISGYRIGTDGAWIQ